MKAFKVYYSTGGKSTSMIVLAKDEGGVEGYLAQKDKDYRIGDRWSKIDRMNEIPLSNVMISDLSATEFIMLMGVAL